MRLVVLPQAARRVTPALLNDFVALQKDCGLISVLGAVDAVRAAQIQVATTYNFTPYVVAGSAVRRTGRSLGAAGGLGDPTRGHPAGRPVNAPVLSVRGLVKRYGERTVLAGVDLDVAEHEVVVLIGASGSGKSTLLKCVDLLEDIDDGQIILDGNDISDPRVDADAARRIMGMVFQSFNLFPHMTVLHNVTLAPRVVFRPQPARGRRAAAASCSTRVGLADKADAYPDKLSGGQQQRVAIARALAYDPRLLLLDEITSALDPELVGEVLDLVRELAASGRTIVMATHEMGFARQVAHTVCFLDGGRIIESGSAEQFSPSPRAADAGVPAPGDRDRAGLRFSAAGSQWPARPRETIG